MQLEIRVLGDLKRDIAVYNLKADNNCDFLKILENSKLYAEKYLYTLWQRSVVQKLNFNGIWGIHVNTSDVTKTRRISREVLFEAPSKIIGSSNRRKNVVSRYFAIRCQKVYCQRS